MSRRAKVYGFLALVVLAAAAVYWIRSGAGGPVARANSSRGPGAAAPAPSEEVFPVELTPAQRGSISSYLSSTANLRALRNVEVAARTDGVVHEVLAEEGDFARKGEVLALLDDADLQIQLNLAEERLAQAQQQLQQAKVRQQKTATQIRNAEIELRRKDRAFEERLISEEELAQQRYLLEELEHDYQVVESEVRQFTHRIDEINAEIAQVKLQIAHTRIRAPFDGRITERMVELGQTVRNLDSLYRIAAFSPLYADVFLSEGEAQGVRPGQRALVTLGFDEGAEAAGEVERVSPVVDEETGTVKVTVRLTPDKPGFKPGAFVRVQIRTDTREGTVLIPKRAVVEEGGERYVFVAEDRIARRRAVLLGYESEGMVEVRDGLDAGEQVVVAGQGRLRDGAPVLPVTAG